MRKRGLLQTQALRLCTPAGFFHSANEPRIPQLAVLMHDDKWPRDWSNVRKGSRTVLAGIAARASDGRVADLELEPELEYGERCAAATPPATACSASSIGPETKVFNELKIAVQLMPGQTLVVAGRASMPGSLGQSPLHRKSPSGQPTEQKLLLFRLMHSPGDDSFRSSRARPAMRRRR